MVMENIWGRAAPSVDLAHHEIFHAKVGKGSIIIEIVLLSTHKMFWLRNKNHNFPFMHFYLGAWSDSFSNGLFEIIPWILEVKA